MKNLFYLVLFVVLLNTSCKQREKFTNYRTFNVEYYRTHKFPSHEEIIKEVTEKYNLNETNGKPFYYDLAKMPDGYYMYENHFKEKGKAAYKNFMKCWSLDSNIYCKLPLKRNAHGERSYMRFRSDYDMNTFYGYPEWYEDVLEVYDGESGLECNELYQLAQAYHQKGLDLLYGKTYERYAVKKVDEKILEESNGYSREAMEYYAQVAEKCPMFDCPLGSARLKNESMNMALYYDREVIGWGKYGEEFLQNASFSPFYVSFGKNILNACEPNAILFVGGDVDTYVCIYLQEKLNYRKDVTVVNTSLCRTGWYIDYLKNKISGNRKIKTVIPTEDYYNELTDYIYVEKSYSPSSRSVNFNVFREKLIKKDRSVMEVTLSGDTAVQVPACEVILIDSLRYKPGTALEKYDLFLMDLISCNQHRPIYFSNTVDKNEYEALSTYFPSEGFVRKFNADGGGGIIADTTRYRYNLSHLDKTGLTSKDDLGAQDRKYFITSYRSAYLDYIEYCNSIGSKAEALRAADEMIHFLPDNLAPYDYYNVSVAKIYALNGQTEKSKAITTLCFDRIKKYYPTVKDKKEFTSMETYQLRLNEWMLNQIDIIEKDNVNPEVMALREKYIKLLQRQFDMY